MSHGTHVPVRMCIGCGARAPQRELLRLSLAAGGGLELAGKAPLGRSAYLHRRPECWEQFAARKGLVRSLGCAVDRATRAATVHALKRTTPGAMMR